MSIHPGNLRCPATTPPGPPILMIPFNPQSPPFVDNYQNDRTTMSRYPSQPPSLFPRHPAFPKGFRLCPFTSQHSIVFTRSFFAPKGASPASSVARHPRLVHHLSWHASYHGRNSLTIRQEVYPSTAGTRADCRIEVVVWYMQKEGPPSGLYQGMRLGRVILVR